MRKVIAVLSLLLIATPPVYAKAFKQDFMNWTKIRWQRFSKNHIDVAINSSFRFIKQDPGFHQNVTTAGLGYSFNPDLAIWLGYAFIPTQPVGSNSFKIEHRSWQMVDWAPIDNEHFALDIRSILEQRYLRSFAGNAWRLRERLQLDLAPLIDFIPSAFTPIVSDELFFDLNHPVWVSSSALGQNRFFVGLSMPIKKKVAVFQLGYMNQYIIGDRANAMRHIFQIGLVFM